MGVEDELPTWKLILAYFSVLANAAMSMIGTVSVQYLDGAVPDFELNVWRFAMQIVLVTPLIAKKKCNVSVPRERIPFFILMCALSTGSNLLIYAAPRFLPLGTYSGMFNSILIASSLLLSLCAKTERKIQLTIGSCIAIVGILFLTQPEFIFEHLVEISNVPESNWTSPCVLKLNTTSDVEVIDETVLGYLLTVAAGVISSGAFFTQEVVVRESDYFICCFWIGVFGTVSSAILMAIFEEPTFPLGAICITLLLSHSLSIAIRSNMGPWSLQYVSAPMFSLIISTQLIFFLVLQYTVLWHIHPGKGNWLEIFGGVVCFSGVVFPHVWTISRSCYKKHSKNKSSDEKEKLLESEEKLYGDAELTEDEKSGRVKEDKGSWWRNGPFEMKCCY